MRRVHHNGVNAGTHQRLNALFSALAHAHCSTDPQLAVRVACRVGKAGLLGDVLYRNQAFEFKRIVDHQQTLDLVQVQQYLGLLQRGAIGHRHQLFAPRHDVTHRQVIAGLETQITTGHQTDHLASVTHRKTGDAKLLRQIHDLAHGVAGRDHYRVTQHAGFIAFDFGHLRRLLLRREVLVHDTNTALLRDGNRQPGFGDGVHGGRHQRQIQRDIAGEAGRKRGVLGQDLGERWHQQNVVEGERFAD